MLIFICHLDDFQWILHVRKGQTFRRDEQLTPALRKKQQEKIMAAVSTAKS